MAGETCYPGIAESALGQCLNYIFALCQYNLYCQVWLTHVLGSLDYCIKEEIHSRTNDLSTLMMSDLPRWIIKPNRSLSSEPSRWLLNHLKCIWWCKTFYFSSPRFASGIKKIDVHQQEDGVIYNFSSTGHFDCMMVSAV